MGTRFGLRHILLAVVIIAGLLAHPWMHSECNAAQVTLRWDYTASGAAGFVLYCGSSSRTYSMRVDVGNVDTYTTGTLPEGTTSFCAVTAYDPAKVESSYSNEVSVAVPVTTPGAPVVNISAYPGSGPAPLNVAFGNTSTGLVTSWSWNFGDGMTSAAQSPTHVYSAPGSYQVSLTATGPGGITTKTLASPIEVTSACECTLSLWLPSATPGIVDSADAQPVELGVKFRADVNGSITGIRFHKSSANTGTHVAHLWTSDGTLLASATFTDETASGWQQVDFSVPVPIIAGTVYIASYHTNSGHYSADNNYFAAGGVNNGALHAPKDAVNDRNGVFTYGASSVFPANTYKSTNYWVDVVFRPVPSQSQYSFWPGNPTPAGAANTDPYAVELGVKFRADVNGVLTGIRFYKFASNTGTHVAHLWDSSGTLLASQTFINESPSGWQQVNFATPIPITAGTTYVASYHTDVGYYAGVNDYFTSSGVDNGPPHALKSGADGPNGVYAYGSAVLFPGNTYKSSNYWVDVVFHACPCTLWPSTAIPTSQGAPDGNPVELGMKFRTDVNGTITGIRFYKTAANVGAHVASLWSATGNLLARAAFSNETSSGWQQVNFATPVPVLAGTTYVASYHTNTGHYAGDTGYFAAAGVDSGPLHGLKDGVSGPNGVFTYASESAFPTSTYESANYWVDVVFIPK